MLSPSSSSASLHVPSSTPIIVSNPYRAPLTPPPPPSVPPPSQRMPFYPPLPWQSFEGAFPSRASRRRRKPPAPQSSSVPVELPSRRGSGADAETIPDEAILAVEAPTPVEQISRDAPTLETPLTSQPPSEALSTQPTTPSSEITPKIIASSRSNVPLIPIVPAVPNLPLTSRASKQASIAVTSDVVNGAPSNADHLANAVETAAKVNAVENGDSVETLSSPRIKAAPKSWADLVRTMGQNSTARTAQATFDSAPKTDAFVPGKAGSLADALSSYSVKDSHENAKIAFLEPRGLVNTGNMCYMNSVSPKCPSEF